MTTAPVAAPRAPRTPTTTDKDAAAGAAGGSDPDAVAAQAQEQALATRTAAFNLLAKEQAEDEREREVLEQMMLAQAKFEDEICKKWIDMI